MKRPLVLLLLCLAACAGKPRSDAPVAVETPAAAAPADTAPAPAADTTPAPAAPTDTAPAPAATPPLPDNGPLPEVPDAGIGYPSPEAALAALRQKPGVSITTQDGWTIAQDQEDPQHLALWSFTPPGHPAHPAMVKRLIYQQDGKAWMSMQVRCGGSKAACDELVRQFQVLNDQLARHASEHQRQAAQPGPPASGNAAQPQPTPAPAASAPPDPPPASAPSPSPAATPPPAPSPQLELWTHALKRECPSHHVEWIGDWPYAPLLTGFESTLPADARSKADRFASRQRLEAYQQLGLLHRFVLYACAQVQCQAPSVCSRSPK